MGLLERVCLRGLVRSGGKVRLEGLAWLLFIVFNGLILRLALLGSFCARNLQVLQGLETFERHLRSLVILLKGCWGLRRVWVLARQAMRAVAIGIEAAGSVTSMLWETKFRLTACLWLCFG